MFKQLIKNGYQAEVPDIWLTEGNPWEVKRNDVRFEVGFSGKTVTEKAELSGHPVTRCEPAALKTRGRRHRIQQNQACSLDNAACAAFRQAKTILRAGQRQQHALHCIALQGGLLAARRCW